MTILHATRRMREINRASANMPAVLDYANDAWLSADGIVSTRQHGEVGNVSHLRGAARIASACRIVREVRA